MKTIKKSELMGMLGNFRSVRNTPSRNGESQAPNQFELFFENGRVFQSYRSLVAVNINGQLYFSPEHDYSVTTSSHLARWCGYNAAERRNMLKNEEAIFIYED